MKFKKYKSHTLIIRQTMSVSPVSFEREMPVIKKQKNIFEITNNVILYSKTQ